MKTSDSVHELFLNYACTAKCPFCYNPPLTQELLRLDLPYERAAQALYQAAKTGAKRLNLHGGEVTLRDDLMKILALARKLGFQQITVVTNGVRLGDRVYVDDMKAAGTTHVRLSIHGPDAATHDPIVAIPGAFERVLKAVDHVRAAKMPLGVNFVIIRANLKTLPAFVERFCGDLDVDDIIVYFPHLRGMMELNAEKEGITYSEAAPWVRKAVKPAARERVLLANFVPCVLPELADRMLDWSHGEAGAAAQTHPEGFTEDILAMKGGQRAPVAACGTCALSRRCLGVESEYRRRFGEEDFTALKELPGGVPA